MERYLMFVKNKPKRVRDYCSGVTDDPLGIAINSCCHKHDNMVGQAGTYNPITPHIEFYKCLKNTELPTYLVLVYTFGGFLFSIWKYPYLVVKKYLYRKNH